jgi:maleamate amidohydrolase
MEHTMQVWEKIIPPEELEIYRLAGFGKKVGFGNKPAILVVDVQYDFTDDAPRPILESIARYPKSCGAAAWEAIPYIRRLIDMGRRKGAPIIYTHSFPRAADTTDPQPYLRNAIVGPLVPEPGDLLIEKEAASPFSNSRLLRKLIGHGIDTLIHTGCTTSGCVRAGVVDGAAYRFKNIVALEGVFDRAQTPHWVNLFDMDQKYADVLPVGQVEAWLAQL